MPNFGNPPDSFFVGFCALDEAGLKIIEASALKPLKCLGFRIQGLGFRVYKWGSGCSRAADSSLNEKEACGSQKHGGKQNKKNN